MDKVAKRNMKLAISLVSHLHLKVQLEYALSLILECFENKYCTYIKKYTEA